MLLDKSALVVALLFALSGCNSSSSADDSSRTGQTPTTGEAQLSTSSVTTTVSNGTQPESGSAGNVTVESNVYIDPTSPDFIKSNQNHFRNAMIGAWISTNCREVETVFSEPSSAQTVFVFTATELVETEYTYNANNCTGVPSSRWYPLPIRSWALGQYRTLLDGTTAWELDTTITQRGIYSGEILHQVGADSYVNIDFVNGELEFNVLEENYKHTRPATRAGVYFEKIPNDEVFSISSDALLGSWYASCTGRLESRYEFFADKLVITDENWADVGCEGDSYAIRKSSFDLEYGDPFSSIFTNDLMAITLTAVSNELLRFDASQGLDEPEFKVPVGKTEYRAVSINNNTLILGYCLYRNSGEDDCQDSENRKPDMVDHNWAVRFDKVR